MKNSTNSKTNLKVKIVCTLPIFSFLQLWSDWGDSTRREQNGGSQGDHCQVILQSLLVKLGVNHNPLDLSFDAWLVITGCILVQHNVNLGQLCEVLFWK